MKISKNTWHFRLYASEYGASNTNLCTYVRCVVLQLLAYALGGTIGAFAIAVLIAASPFWLGIILLHGLYPTRFNPFKKGSGDWFKEYPPIRAFGLRFYPSHIVSPLLFVGLMTALWAALPASLWETDTYEMVFVFGLMGIILGLITFCSFMGARLVLRSYPEQEPVHKSSLGLLYEYAKAKKARICPVVTFEG